MCRRQKTLYRILKINFDKPPNINFYNFNFWNNMFFHCHVTGAGNFRYTVRLISPDNKCTIICLLLQLWYFRTSSWKSLWSDINFFPNFPSVKAMHNYALILAYYFEFLLPHRIRLSILITLVPWVIFCSFMFLLLILSLPRYGKSHSEMKPCRYW